MEPVLPAWEGGFLTPGQPWKSQTLIFKPLCCYVGISISFTCSCLENPRDRGAWLAAVYGVTQSRTRLKRLSSCSSGNRKMEDDGVEGTLSKGLLLLLPLFSHCVGSDTFATPRTVAPARLFCPWDFPSKNTGVGCHFLLQGIQLEKSRLWLSKCYPRPAASASPGNLLEIQYSIRMSGDQTQ